MTIDIISCNNPLQDIHYLDALMTLERNAIQTNSAPYTMTHDRQFFFNNLSGQARNILAFDRGQVIGYSCYRSMASWPEYLEPLPYAPERCVMFVYTLVDSQWRGQGIGRRLNQARIEGAQQDGFRYAFVTVHPDNKRNLAIQLSLGFHILAQRPMFKQQLMRNLLFMELG